MGIRLPAVLLGVLMTGGLVAGCAGGGSRTGEPATPGGSVSSSSSSSSSSASPPEGGGASSPAAGVMTLTGVVEPGVEAGCLIMNVDGKVHLLLDGPPDVVKAGARITVRGRPDPTAISYCQQGEPFRIAEAHAA